MSRVGIVAFSFALRDEEPNPCNIRLAEEVRRAAKRFLDPDPVIVCQWEVGIALVEDGFPPVTIVGPLEEGYLDSEKVWEGAKKEFEQQGVRKVVPIAQPFLQMTKVKMMINRDGYEVIPWKVRWIGFDNDPRNTQWWTKGPLQLCLYAVRQAIFGSRG